MSIRVEVQTDDASRQMWDLGTDISEIHSFPRVAHACGMGEYGGIKLRPGWSFDLTAKDPDTGDPWNFGKKETSEKAERITRQAPPLILICNPMCTDFSRLQALNKHKRKAEDISKDV